MAHTSGAKGDTHCIGQLVDANLHPTSGFIVKDNVLSHGLHLHKTSESHE